VLKPQLTYFQSIDVGAALEKMLYDDSTAGQTFELYGPKEYTMAQIAALVDKEIFKERRHVNLPKALLKPVAGILNRVLWWHTMSADEIEREFMDQVIDPEAKTFKDLGIEPGDIANFTYHYLVSDEALAIQTSLTISTARIP
jgi:NADH dehydrogenase (ubiquinone) 1 alpha subcomplex subunit 9